MRFPDPRYRMEDLSKHEHSIFIGFCADNTGFGASNGSLIPDPITKGQRPLSRWTGRGDKVSSSGDIPGTGIWTDISIGYDRPPWSMHATDLMGETEAE